VLAEIAVALPAVLLGLAAGSALYRRANATVFRRAVLGILFVSAGIALVSAFLQ
jgi:hypothetical protein